MDDKIAIFLSKLKTKDYLVAGDGAWVVDVRHISHIRFVVGIYVEVYVHGEILGQFKLENIAFF